MAEDKEKQHQEDMELMRKAIEVIRRRQGRVKASPAPSSGGNTSSTTDKEKSQVENTVRIRNDTKSALIVDKEKGKVYGIPKKKRKSKLEEAEERRQDNDKVLRNYNLKRSNRGKSNKKITKLATVLTFKQQDSEGGGEDDEGQGDK